ncbi:MAG: LacI family DNA-binding transcriptional regulator [Spirochaetaceae bacterium]|nr:LacI family DNA-binding transcriptional regulator [Spirochaetaceae bacterium]
MPKKITYKELSIKTGISISTISRIMKGTTKVNKEKRKIIYDTLKELGLPLPSSNNNGKRIILVNLPTLPNPFYGDITNGIKAAALRNNYSILVQNEQINEQTIDGLILLLKSINAYGLITLNQINSDCLLKLNKEIPLVQCCERNKSVGIPYVTIDDIAATKKAVELLISHGNKHIAIINGPIRYKYAKERLLGYRETLIQNDFKIDPQIIIQLPEINFEMALSASFQLLSSDNPPDAFFTVSDIYAAAVVHSAKKLKLRVPEDIEVIGFDNVEISSMCIPTITTVSQPSFQIGLNSCDMLVQIINGEINSARSMNLSTELILRGTTR